MYLVTLALYSIFINEIEELLQDQGIQGGVTIGDIVLYLLLYADDIVLIARTDDHLQQLLHKLLDFCNLSKLAVNVKKTFSLRIARGRSLVPRTFT